LQISAHVVLLSKVGLAIIAAAAAAAIAAATAVAAAVAGDRALEISLSSSLHQVRSGRKEA
jgi:hypothetical protein